MIHWKTLRLFALLIFAGPLGCAATGDSESSAAHDTLDAVTWIQASSEYAAVTTSLYAAAADKLGRLAASSPGGAGSMAVVLDIDETVLDNSPYQGQLIARNATYTSDTWDEWIARRAATAVPGVVEFIRTAQSLGVHVAFITNRACRLRPGTDAVCPQKEDTRANLERIGIETGSTTLFLRGERPPAPCRALLLPREQADGTWSSDKSSRRECVRLNNDIAMLFGDQLGDFTSETASTLSGRELATEHSDSWGSAWFMLPNPTYGDWRSNSTDEKRSRLRTVE